MKWTAFKAYDWHQYCEVVKQRPNVTGWKSSSLSHGDAQWTGTAGPAANIALMTHGWPEGTRRIVEGVNALQAAQDDTSPQWAMDAAGAFPDVGAYLAGEIEYMHNPDMEQPAPPILRLCLPGMYHSGIHLWQIENFGIALLTLIDSLERDGRQIELVWQSSLLCTKPSRKGSKKRVLAGLPPCCVEVTLKRAGEHMDLDRMAYAIAHPSMLRRSSFAVMEQFFEFAALGDTFGTPTDYPEEAKDPEAVYIPRLCPDLYDLSNPAGALASLRRYVEL
jgi:hypothetical protein